MFSDLKKLTIRIVLQLASKFTPQIRFIFIGTLSVWYYHLRSFINRVDYSIHRWAYKEVLVQILNSGKKIIIFAPSTDWHDLKQRPQHLARAFSEMDDVILIFCTNNQTVDQCSGIEKISDSLYLVSNLYLLRKNVVADILYVVWSLANKYATYLKSKKITYDFPDEISFFPSYSTRKAIANHEEVMNKADLITPSSDFLLQQISTSKRENKIVLVLNGVFPEDFILQCENTDQILTELKKGNSPVIGFYGWLWEAWIDFPLIKSIAIKHPDKIVVLIGWCSDEWLANSWILQLNNVRYLGPKPYLRLKGYAQFFDVAIIPFLVNDLTLAASPIKMFEYMTQGLPVLATNLPECQKYASVRVALNHEDFIAQIQTSIRLKQDSAYIGALIQDAINNTWHSRVAAIRNSLINV